MDETSSLHYMKQNSFPHAHSPLPITPLLWSELDVRPSQLLLIHHTVDFVNQ